MSINLHIVHAFSTNNKGGNPAGVVLAADELSAQQKQAIAAQAGLSETAFVSTGALAPYKLEFFTPTRAIPYCGHATVAAFALLAAKGKLAGGVHEVEIHNGLHRVSHGPDGVFLQQPHPAIENISEAAAKEAMAAIGLTQRAAGGATPVIASSGNRFLLLPLGSIPELRKAKPDDAAIAALSERFNLIGFYPFVALCAPSQRDAAARMFAPRYGIPEEAATGMAAGPLAGYLAERAATPKRTFTLSQGVLMPKPSPSKLVVHRHASGLWVGGESVLQRTQTLAF